MNEKPSSEDILYAFSVEPRHDRETLECYIGRYPEVAVDLIDLSHELRMVETLGPSEAEPESDETFQAALAQYLDSKPLASDNAGAVDLFTQFKGPAFAALATTLKVPRSILMALRDRLVEPSTIPHRFHQRLAQASGASLEVICRYLALPPGPAVAQSFKADNKPSAQGQVSFEDLIQRTNLTDEQKKMLQDDLEADGCD